MAALEAAVKDAEKATDTAIVTRDKARLEVRNCVAQLDEVLG